MNDWEASTDDVRRRFASQHGVWDDADEARFNRWLAEVERAAAEKAWNAAIEQGFDSGWIGEFDALDLRARNPYRKETR